jgi:uncharacterized Zn finger protein
MRRMVGAAVIANILHRDTLSVIAGKRIFDRGQDCFAAGRVIAIQASAETSELRGTVRPNEAGREPYTTRIWMRDEGLAYECTCPIGIKRQFCKHAVAIAIAHLEHEKQTLAVDRDYTLLREAMLAVSQDALVTGLLGLAKRDAELATSLKRICLEALSSR